MFSGLGPHGPCRRLPAAPAAATAAAAAAARGGVGVFVLASASVSVSLLTSVPMSTSMSLSGLEQVSVCGSDAVVSDLQEMNLQGFGPGGDNSAASQRWRWAPHTLQTTS